MPPLRNQKWELFAQGIAAGKTGDQAYQDAGYKPNADNASRLKGTERVKARIAELQQRVETKIIAKTAITKAWVLEMLRENAERAMQHQAARNAQGEEIGEYSYNGSVANRALELIGKEKGMFIERHEHGRAGEFEKYTDAELVQMLAAEAQALLEDHSGENDEDEKE